MKYQPLISIITPTYNHEKYISECIESVLSQSYENWEMIIIDDCSTDNTMEIVKRYTKIDNRIKCIRHEKNYGPLYLDKTYNEALKISNGEWIAIIEGDDVWLPYKLEKQVFSLNEFSNEDVVLLHGRCGIIWEDLNIVTINRTAFMPKLSNKYDAFTLLANGLNPIYSPSAIVKKEALLKIGGFIQKPREIRLVDFPTWLYLSRLGKFYFDNTILGFWRRHSKSITMNYEAEIAMNCQKVIEYFLEEDNENCIFKAKTEYYGGILYLGLIFNSIINKEWEKAKDYIKKFETFLDNKKFKIDNLTKLKVLFYKVVINFRSLWLLSKIYNFKRKYLDKVICNYEPGFFKKSSVMRRIKRISMTGNINRYR